jgi:hypothetical protein
MTRVRLNFPYVVGLLVFCLPALSNSVGPRPETIQAWEYVQNVESRTKSAGGGRQFLWIDQDPQRAQENVVLSRSIPASLRWLVEPAVRQLSRNVVEAYLRDTREAVCSQEDAKNLPARAELASSAAR